MLLAATTTSGCLLGPDIEGLPEEELHAPTIALDQVDPIPQGWIEVTNPGDCDMKLFSLGRVSDKNLDDTLTVRWFLNWKGRDSRDGFLIDRNLLPTGTVDRFDPFALEYELNLNYPFINLDGPNTITAVVADRPMVNSTGIGFPDTEEGSQGQWTLFQWTFVFSDAGLCN